MCRNDCPRAAVVVSAHLRVDCSIDDLTREAFELTGRASRSGAGAGVPRSSGGVLRVRKLVEACRGRRTLRGCAATQCDVLHPCAQKPFTASTP